MDSTSETCVIATTNSDLYVVTVDLTHILCLYASDTIGASLISVQLNRYNNHAFWSRTMYISLVVNNKLGFIDGSCKKELFDPLIHNILYRCNAIVFPWSMNSVSRELISTILYSTSVFFLWSPLRERFKNISGSRIFQRHIQISLVQQGVDFVSIFFACLCMMWKEFSTITCLSCFFVLFILFMSF